MKKRFILLMVICFSSICAQILGQTAFPKFYHLTRNNGLPSNRVNCIAEDKQGFIWFGTEDGLSKYNGYDFEVYRNLQGLNNRIPDNAIDFILEDQNNNNLWLATRKGLVYFDRIYQKFEVVISSELEDSTTGNINITSLCFDDANNLWIGTFKGIYVYNLEHKKLFSLNHIQNKGLSKSSELRVYTLFKDNRNDMWVGYEEGLLKFNKKDSSFVQYFKEQNLRSIQTIFQDSKSNYWVGSDKLGLYFIKNHPDKGITRNFCKANGDFIGNRVHGIIEDDENKFLIMVRDGGLYYY